MSLNHTPASERVHIAFFGRRNVGKSSLANAVTGQNLAVVSDYKGTTTDPVYKAMELLPLGPVEIIDTPGFDDEGQLGNLRVAKTRQVLAKTDIAVLVTDGPLGEAESELQALFQEHRIPVLLVRNKKDEASADSVAGALWVSAKTGEGIPELKDRLAALAPRNLHAKPLIQDLLEPGDLVILVIPIDESAPKGRIILPQQQVLREILDAGAQALCCRETELGHTLECHVSATPEADPSATASNTPSNGKRLKMIVTDSQVFEYVRKVTPKDIPLTSFSILMARHKGFLDTAMQSVKAIDTLEDGDKILIAEGCTHHRQCNDIGTVKIPRWLHAHTGKDVQIDTCSGRDFPETLDEYRLVIHCGGCMLNDREVGNRMRRATQQGIPFINYGVLIAYMKGVEFIDFEETFG